MGALEVILFDYLCLVFLDKPDLYLNGICDIVVLYLCEGVDQTCIEGVALILTQDVLVKPLFLLDESQQGLKELIVYL